MTRADPCRRPTRPRSHRPLPRLAAGRRDRPGDHPRRGRARRWSRRRCSPSELGCEVWLKVEGANPTGSFKDRGMTVAVSVSAGEGAEAVVCASTGNTSASAAAYASRGWSAADRAAAGRPDRRRQAGPGDRARRPGRPDRRQLRRLPASWPARWPRATRWRWSTRSTRSASRGRRPPPSRSSTTSATRRTCTCCRSGNGGNISAYWRGYTQYAEAGIASRRPRMWAFQAAGAAPLVLGHPVPNPETVATAIRIGNPASTALAVAANEESGGLLRGRHRRRDPRRASGSWPRGRASSSSRPRPPAWPVCWSRRRRGEVDPGQQIVVTVTGHGLKDIDTALSGEDRSRPRSWRPS